MWCLGIPFRLFRTFWLVEVRQGFYRGLLPMLARRCLCYLRTDGGEDSDDEVELGWEAGEALLGMKSDNVKGRGVCLGM